MATSPQTISPFRSPFYATLVAPLTRIGAKAHGVLRTLQMARMLSILSNMSDSQLAQIGISRSDIPKYAETLMSSR